MLRRLSALLVASPALVAAMCADPVTRIELRAAVPSAVSAQCIADAVASAPSVLRSRSYPWPTDTIVEFAFAAPDSAWGSLISGSARLISDSTGLALTAGTIWLGYPRSLPYERYIEAHLARVTTVITSRCWPNRAIAVTCSYLGRGRPPACPSAR
jgi:hypothetical protein